MSASRQLALGVFLVGGLLLFALGLFWIGDRRRLFNESIEIYTEFSNISGLARGAPVRVSGLDAGEVLEIRIPPNPDMKFRLRFRTSAEFRSILRMNSVASIQNDGLVGNKFLQVDAGTSAAMEIQPGVTIPSKEPVEVSELINRVNDTLKNANDAVTEIRAGITSTVKSVQELSTETTEVIGDVSKQLDRFTTTANDVGDDVRVMVASVRRGEGTVGKLMNDDGLYLQLRAMADDGGRVLGNLKATSADLSAISADLKARDLGAKVDQVTNNVQDLTKEALEKLRSFQTADGSASLFTEVRQTLTSANETMANFADNSEALKRNFFFRGFFKDRGYYDLDELTVREYQEGRFLKDRQKIQEWVDSTNLFELSTAGREQISEEGRRRLDLAMAGFLRFAKTDPLVVESWVSGGAEPERVLRSRERAIMVREYLMKKFSLKPNYVAVMPMNASSIPPIVPRDGVNLVLYATKEKK